MHATSVSTGEVWDAADQLIVATAGSLSATAITKDARLRDYAHARTTW